MPSAALLGDPGDDALGVGQADVGYPVGAQHHDVDATRTVGVPRLFVAQRQAGRDIRASAGARPSSAVRRASRCWTCVAQHELDLVVEGDHRDRVVGTQALGQQRERVPDQAQPVAHAHRARPVDDQSEVHRRTLLGLQLARGDGHPHDLGARLVRGPDAGLRADVEVVLGRRRVAVVEGVDPLLDAHRLRGDAVRRDHRLRHPVGPVVHVQRERRLRVGGRVGVAAHALVLERVPRAGHAGPVRRLRRQLDVGAAVPGRGPDRVLTVAIAAGGQGERAHQCDREPGPQSSGHVGCDAASVRVVPRILARDRFVTGSRSPGDRRLVRRAVAAPRPASAAYREGRVPRS